MDFEAEGRMWVCVNIECTRWTVVGRDEGRNATHHGSALATVVSVQI